VCFLSSILFFKFLFCFILPPTFFLDPTFYRNSYGFFPFFFYGVLMFLCSVPII
jgi:hypothetical protein